jgi:hypothetical protein
MRIAVSILAVVLACSLHGCGVSPITVPGAKNDGAMVPLPDKRGFVEVRVDGGGGRGTRGGRGKAELKTIVVYFYGPDGSTEMSPAPTGVTLKIDKDPAVPLTPQATGGAFASKPGDFPNGFRGTLAAEIGGQSIETPVAIR